MTGGKKNMTSVMCFSCTISVIQETFHPHLPFCVSAQLRSHTPLRCTPTPSSILLRAWQKPALPCLLSLRPPQTPTSPAHGGQRTRKRRRKSCICLSEIADHHLAPTPTVHMLSWEMAVSCNAWRATGNGKWQFWDGSVIGALMGTGEGDC